MRRTRVLRLGSVLALAGGLAIQLSSSPPIARGFDLSTMAPHLRAHVSGAAETAAGPELMQSQQATNYFPSNDECQGNLGSNVKVNQNCLNVSDVDLQGRGQAQNETSIAVDPNNPQHVLASFNDYRRGDATCGVSYSLDGAKTWNDSTVPNGFTRGAPFGSARQYWQGGGDTSVAFDTKGNAYLSCQAFMRGKPVTSNQDLSSAFLVFRSTHNAGASWNFPGRYTTVFPDLAGAGAVLEDKALMTVDNHVGSPFQDRVYVTWTEFTATTAYIYAVRSDDYAQTFSNRVLVSTASALCTFPLTKGGGCDNNQFSQPFTGPDGALYVVWSNYNTVDFNATHPLPPAKYQVLIAKSTDGGLTFSAPQKVADYYELPDCPTYQGKDPGRACVPEKGSSQNSFFRAANYPSAAVNPQNPKQLIVSIASYISRNSQESNGCVPTETDPNSTGGLYTGVKTVGACNNKIVVSTSTNGGATFNGATTDVRNMPTASSGRRQAVTDQWFQWLDVSRSGKVAIAYYDRQYGDDETTGFSDQSVAGAESVFSSEYGVTRASSASMPPPTQFSGTFWGDYGGVATAGESALPLWSDTRSVDLFICPGTALPGVPPQLCTANASNAARANDQDIFVARVAIPSHEDDGDN
jgi:hypothetical protein